MSPTLLLPLLLGTGFALQPPGSFHGDEAVAADGESWLGLRLDGDDATLVATIVRVRPIEDVVAGDAPGQRSGREVTSIHGDAIAMYLRGPRLRAGPIERAQTFSDASQSVASMPDYSLEFRGQRHRITAHCDPEPVARVDAQAQFVCRVLLDAPGRSQVLWATTGYFEPGATTPSLGDDAAPTLLFAGDLDRDGRLDLILDVTDHYNVRRPTLFLSTLAAPGELLGIAARFQSVGC